MKAQLPADSSPDSEFSDKRAYASLSLDLDNEWAYLKTRGDVRWQQYPSYLHLAVPALRALLEKEQLRLTVFVVGQDAALPEAAAWIAGLAAAGHEMASHSMSHEPDLASRNLAQVHAELHAAEVAIERATGVRPLGFRGPSFAISPTTVQALHERGYHYDASTWPTSLAPLAAWVYRLMAGRTAEQPQAAGPAFGAWRNALQPLNAFVWAVPQLSGDQRGLPAQPCQVAPPHLEVPMAPGHSSPQQLAKAQPLVEVPVTTMPLLRLPMHMSYLLFLAQGSQTLALAYLRLALALCRWRGVAPSMLLHPLDVLDASQVPSLAFFPAMGMPAQRKRAFVGRCLALLKAHFQVLTVAEHAVRARGLGPLVLRQAT